MIVEAYAAMYCLAATVFWEARSEPPEGQFAVAYVVMNRVEDERWPDDVCSVVYQPHQFSWVKDPQQIDKTNVLERRAWRIALNVASYTLDTWDRKRFAADHYHTVDTFPLPMWVKGMRPYTRIGKHVFYKTKED